MSLLALYGSLHQLKRMTVYEDFCKKQAVVLFATDIAARGLVEFEFRIPVSKYFS